MSCKKFEIIVKPGDDIKWTGLIEQANIDDFTGYTLAAQFRAKNMTSELPATLLADATIEWIDEVAGTFYVIVDRADTADWSFGITIMLDISVMHPDGTRVRTETVEFSTTAGVTETM